MYPAKLLHMKELLGGAWSPFDEYIGIDKRLRRLIVNKPGYAARIDRRTQAALDMAYEQLQPFPLPEHHGLSRKRWLFLKQRPGDTELREFVIMLEGYLLRSQPRSIAERIADGYMKAVVVGMSKGLHHKNMHGWFGGHAGWKLALAEAETECERNIRMADEALIDDLSRDDRYMVERLRVLLIVNWIALVLEQAKRGYHRKVDEALVLLEERGALETLTRSLREYPYIWQIAYNGLDLASMLKRDAEALEFYQHLKRLDPGFQSFDYPPGEAPALSAEPGMAHFCRQYREQLHIPLP
jgi:hypothetical protein